MNRCQERGSISVRQSLFQPRLPPFFSTPRPGVDSTRSPSPLGCGALDGCRSAAPPPRAAQLQVPGGAGRRSPGRAWGGPEPSSAHPYSLQRPTQFPPLLWQSHCSSNPSGEEEKEWRPVETASRRSSWSLRAGPADSLGAGPIDTGCGSVSVGSVARVPM